MHKLCRTPRVLMLMFLAAFFAASAGIAFATLPALAAPAAQNSLPDFDLEAQTVVSVTVAISDGQVIVIPIALLLEAQNRSGEAELTLLTDFEEQAGIFIGVSPTNAFPATLLRPGEAVAEEGAPAPSTAPSATGTHVTNTNSRLRAGPGTNFDIVGRVPQGGAVTVVGQNEDGTWYQLEDGSWIAEFLLEPVENGQDNTGQDNDENEDEDDAEVESEVAENDQADLTAYLGDVTTIGTGAADTLAALEALADNAQPLSSQWRDAVAAQLTSLAGALDQYLSLTPIAGYEDFHAQLTAVVLTCEQAGDSLAAGIVSPYVIDEAEALQAVQVCISQTSALSTEAQALQ